MYLRSGNTLSLVWSIGGLGVDDVSKGMENGGVDSSTMIQETANNMGEIYCQH